jgi:hypothetical protein
LIAISWEWRKSQIVKEICGLKVHSFYMRWACIRLINWKSLHTEEMLGTSRLPKIMTQSLSISLRVWIGLQYPSTKQSNPRLRILYYRVSNPIAFA